MVGIDLLDGDAFGSSVASLHDLDADGEEDLAVGAPGRTNTGSSSTGAVLVCLLHPNRTIKSSRWLGQFSTGGLPIGGLGGTPLRFGASMNAVSPCVGRGSGSGVECVSELLVGAPATAIHEPGQGALVLVGLGHNSSQDALHGGIRVESGLMIGSGQGGMQSQGSSQNESFGSAVGFLGDIDGDGRPEVLVGSDTAIVDGVRAGAVHTLSLHSENGTVYRSVRLDAATNNATLGAVASG